MKALMTLFNNCLLRVSCLESCVSRLHCKGAPGVNVRGREGGGGGGGRNRLK